MLVFMELNLKSERNPSNPCGNNNKDCLAGGYKHFSRCDGCMFISCIVIILFLCSYIIYYNIIQV
jgi:hypothetical protein